MSSQDPQKPACAGAGASQTASKFQDVMIQNTLSNIKHILLVMSGKGGVGKSSVAANLAVALAQRGHTAGLLDVDLHGPSIAGMMGLKGLLDITPDRFVIPMAHETNLKVVSMQSLMQDPDQPVIWRGPAKNGVIRQFLADVKWGELDYLVIDSPPGTGDEPLSVAQNIPQAKALVVTTPQNVALADVRKSINFCRTLGIEILGVIENMGPFPCPCCGETISLFKSEGGARMAADMEVRFLGSLPFDPAVVASGDQGTPLAAQAAQDGSKGFNAALAQIIDTLTGIVEKTG